MRVACVQLNSRDDKAANVAAASGLVRQAAAAGARLVVLPETWNFKGPPEAIARNAEPLDGPSSQVMSELAGELGVFLLAGSIYETSPVPRRAYNTGVLYGPDGQELAVYRKIHLFDATVGVVPYLESGSLVPGEDVVAAGIEGLTVGLSICYDLRFPELYLTLAQRGAAVMLVPSAFTALTGAAHWELLVRARAVDTGSYVLAPDQVGSYAPGRECYGHSMIVDPWGRVLAELPEGVGVCMADVDPAVVERVRADLPVLRHRRPAACPPQP